MVHKAYTDNFASTARYLNNHLSEAIENSNILLKSPIFAIAVHVPAPIKKKIFWI